MQSTLHNLGLIDKKLSITPQALMDYIVASCPDLMLWESEHYSDILEVEEDAEQLQALHDLKGMEIKGDLIGTLRRIYHDS